MKKILLISNSFGVDSTRYLYGITRAAKYDIKVATLYIGGCSLSQHYRNMLSEERVYTYYINGIDSGLRVSLKEALLSDEWDIVATQQSSPLSGQRDTYFPYITKLASYIYKMAPTAKLWLQMTWTFAEGHPRFQKTPFESRAEMIPAIRSAYTTAAEAIGADCLVPSLDAMCKLYEAIGERAYRDGYHCNKGIARYMLGCLWFMLLYGRDVTDNSFRDFDVEVSEEDVALAKKIAKDTFFMGNGILLR